MQSAEPCKKLPQLASDGKELPRLGLHQTNTLHIGARIAKSADPTSLQGMQGVRRVQVQKGKVLGRRKAGAGQGRKRNGVGEWPADGLLSMATVCGEDEEQPPAGGENSAEY